MSKRGREALGCSHYSWTKSKRRARLACSSGSYDAQAVCKFGSRFPFSMPLKASQCMGSNGTRGHDW